MEENTTKRRTPVILGYIALIALLVAAVEFIFLGLDRILPQTEGQAVTAEASEREVEPSGASREDAPSFCPHCGKKLREGFAWGQFCPYCGNQVE